jgi:serine/threonine-protein kinase
MQDERWRQVEKIFHDLTDRTPEQRASYLEQVCANDPLLKKEVEQLIEAYEGLGSSLHFPAAAYGSLVGRSLGSYKVEGLLGFGGMGHVYRARDLKLKREVAIKILPEEFAQDPDRVTRFQREAEVLASLNHPNIGAIYDLEEADGCRFLVLELVEGETLAERIGCAPIPLEEALSIANQVCDALGAAHERGIIHRDLKPANVKITPDGKVKVLDFGLAKATDNAAPNTPLSNSPTVLAGTMSGMILGTAGYMAPEQAKGRIADKRSDVWAFGCVLYEMLTGKMAFKGEDVSDTLAAVLCAEPDWTALPADLSPSVRALIEGSLKKDRRERIADISTARFLMSEPIASLRPREGARQISMLSRALPFTVTALVVAALTASVMWLYLRSTPLPVARSTLVLPEEQNFNNPGFPVAAISRDGSRLVYAANSQLYVRSMSSDFDSKIIHGTEGSRPSSPAFSPDGQSIAFYDRTDRAIKRISISGGPSLMICPVNGAPYSMTWDAKGILFAAPGKGIMRVPVEGGTPEVLVKLNAGEDARAPQILADGETVLFTLGNASVEAQGRRAQIVVQSLKTAQRTPLISDGAFGRYVPTGHIVYQSGDTLFAAPFDVRRLALTGEAMSIIDGVRGDNNFSFSETGSLIYIPGAAGVTSSQLDLAFLDRKGAVEALNLPPAAYQHPRVSPDGKRVAYSIDDGKDIDIWVYDLSGTSAPRRLTSGGRNRFPIWSGTGQWIAFQSKDDAIYLQRADFSGRAERLTTPEPDTAHIPESWSHKDETLLYTVTATRDSTISLWTLSLRDRKPVEFPGVRSTTPTDAMFSPDGRWVVYLTTSAYVNPRNPEVYVQPFPPTGEKALIHSGGFGVHPMWSSNNGLEVLFSEPVQMMTVKVISTHPAFTFSTPALFLARPRIVRPWPAQRNYDIAADGRLLGIISAEDDRTPPRAPQIRIVSNWFRELQEHVPVK